MMFNKIHQLACVLLTASLQLLYGFFLLLAFFHRHVHRRRRRFHRRRDDILLSGFVGYFSQELKYGAFEFFIPSGGRNIYLCNRIG